MVQRRTIHQKLGISFHWIMKYWSHKWLSAKCSPLALYPHLTALGWKYMEGFAKCNGATMMSLEDVIVWVKKTWRASDLWSHWGMVLCMYHFIAKRWQAKKLEVLLWPCMPTLQSSRHPNSFPKVLLNISPIHGKFHKRWPLNSGHPQIVATVNCGEINSSYGI